MMMLRAIAAALTLGAAMSLPALAQAAVNDGIAAYGKGDYATAFKEFSAAAMRVMLPASTCWPASTTPARAWART